MNIPDHLLSEVSCALCNCFLSSSPVFNSPNGDGRSICKMCNKSTAPRNLAYEALAQLMTYPCRWQGKGCKEQLVWNAAKEHEDECQYGEKPEMDSEEQPLIEVQENCSICQKNIYVLPRYECVKGHKICPKCNSRSVNRCILCKSNIDNDVKYLCRYWTIGCKLKATRDIIMQHESDCDMRSYSCPFRADDCKWSGTAQCLLRHVRNAHSAQTIDAEETTREFRMKDDTWVMTAHEEVFRCFVWVGETDVEWLAKYIGPQRRCYYYDCEVRLHNKSKTILKMTNKCHGWNNVTLEKCIKVAVRDLPKYMTDGKMNFKFKILKNDFANGL